MADNEPTAHLSKEPAQFAARLVSITKRFPGVLANDSVSIDVRVGAFHAVIGENGAGKSTLLSILYGRYRPDQGRIHIGGEDVTDCLNSPADAIHRGMGLVSQHYALIPALTVLENIILGAEPVHAGGILNTEAARERITALMRQLDIQGIDLGIRTDRLSVAAGQKVEIVKALFKGARILLLDEPTATLAPQEADSLFGLLKALLANGTTIVFVTHKLREVMAYSHFVTVLRDGRNAGNYATSETAADELLLQMIGPRAGGAIPARAGDVIGATAGPGKAAARQRALPREEIQRIDETSGEPPDLQRSHGTGSDAKRSGGDGQKTRPRLRINGLNVKGSRGAPAVQDVTLEVRGGEIVGIAGVDGSGQRELAECISGLRNSVSGTIGLASGESDAESIDRKTVRERQRLGIAMIPEDRHRDALILDFTIAENYLLGHEQERSWGGGVLLGARRMLDRANAMIRDYDVRLGDRDAQASARALSGGNQQKVVIARSLESTPTLLIACQPTRGLDVEAARFVYRALRSARDRGLAILLFSLDLDEIMELSDRIVVMFNGRIAGTLPRAGATTERVGALMTGSADGVSASRTPGPAAR